MNLEVRVILLAIVGGLGLTLIISQLLPAQPSLKDALDRLSGKPDRHDLLTTTKITQTETTRVEVATLNVGLRLYPILITQRWLKIPVKDLAILQRGVPRFLGDKVLSAVAGLFLPSALNLVAALAGVAISWRFPVLAGVALAIALFFAGDIEVRRLAAAARTEFRRALGAYIELAALCRNAGIGVTQSLEVAAKVGDTWVFQQLTDALDNAAYSGRNSWTALEVVSHELDIPDLADVADIMELSGVHGTSVYAPLRASAAQLRNTMMSADQGDSRSATQKMSAPLAGLAVLFFILLLIPAMSNIVNG